MDLAPKLGLLATGRKCPGPNSQAMRFLRKSLGKRGGLLKPMAPFWHGLFFVCHFNVNHVTPCCINLSERLQCYFRLPKRMSVVLRQRVLAFSQTRDSSIVRAWRWRW